MLKPRAIRQFRDRRNRLCFLQGLWFGRQPVPIHRTEAYRQAFFPKDRRNAQIAVGLIGLGMQAFALVDVVLLFPSWAFVTTSFIRLLMVASYLWILWRLRQIHTYDELHCYLGFLMIAGLLAIFYFNSLFSGEEARSQGIVEVDTALLVAWYFLAPAAGFWVGFWAVVWALVDILSINTIWHDVDALTKAGQLTLLVMVNVLGVIWLQMRSQQRQAQLSQNQHPFEPHDRLALEKLAFTDELTGVANRRGVLEQLAPWVEQYRLHETDPPILLLADLDQFKSINDTYGHLTGDRVLQAFAQAMQDWLQTTLNDRALFGRLGGEEFLIVLLMIPSSEALAIAHSLCDICRCQEVLSEDEKVVQFTVSIGVSLVSNNDIAITDAISRCDAALYRAKRKGRDRVEWELPSV